MAQKLNAELWDKMHYLFRDYNDRMVHVELDYDFRINVDALKTVLVCFLEKAPVLHSEFIDNHIRPFWKVKTYDIDEIVTVYETDEADLEEEKHRFLTKCLPPDGDIQMKAAVFFHGDKTALCIIENHMCMDGGDFKYFIKALCANYNNYVENGVSPLELRQGTRSYERVYDGFSSTEQRMAKNLYKNINAKDDHAFPFTESDPGDSSFIAKHKLSAEKLSQIKAAGKSMGATINDMLTAAYFYSLYELAGFDKNESMTVSCAIDLRRHIRNTDDMGVTNHTSWMQCCVPERGRDIKETLQYVVRSSNKFKQDKFMGLYGLPLLSLGYKILPHAFSEEIIKIGYSNPLIAMSNIGILEADKLALEGHEPYDAFMSGAVKFKPFALLSVTTLRSEITLSMCVRGNDEDRKIVERLFELMDENIEALIS